MVLITCSDFFRNVLIDLSTRSQYPIIYLNGVSGREMEILIQFMYLGEIDVAHADIGELLSIAESLQIKGLSLLNSEVKSRNESSSFNKVSKESHCQSKVIEPYNVSSLTSKENILQLYQTPTPSSDSSQREVSDKVGIVKENLNQSFILDEDIHGNPRNTIQNYIDNSELHSIDKSSPLFNNALSSQQCVSDFVYNTVSSVPETSDLVKTEAEELVFASVQSTQVQLLANTDRDDASSSKVILNSYLLMFSLLI